MPRRLRMVEAGESPLESICAVATQRKCARPEGQHCAGNPGWHVAVRRRPPRSQRHAQHAAARHRVWTMTNAVQSASHQITYPDMSGEQLAPQRSVPAAGPTPWAGTCGPKGPSRCRRCALGLAAHMPAQAGRTARRQQVHSIEQGLDNGAPATGRRTARTLCRSDAEGSAWKHERGGALG